ncbi:MAG: hypothetical protein HYU66_25720, partial [Armatimonadetes bacterium]|nr:hypothetical protein [Armatimonadota bacterium]
AFLLVQMEMGHSGGPFPTTFSLFGNVVLWLTLLVSGNALLGRVRPRWAFSSAELLTLYVMLCIGSALCSVDFQDVLLPMIGHPVRFADDGNHWAERILPHEAPGLILRDAAALRGWYEGNTTLYHAEFLRAWRGPVILWSGFILVMLWVMWCLAVIFRRRWVDHERLAFPVLTVPLAMCDPRAALWRQPALWQGMAVGGGITLLNGLAQLIPALPSIRVKAHDIGPMFVSPPWNALGWTPVSWYPFAVGLGYLLPLDLLFSSWFFYFWFKAERVVGSLLGLQGAIPRFPYSEEQCTGAYIAVALAAMWTGRRHLALVLRETLHPPAAMDRREGATYRTAVVGLVAGVALLAAFYHRAGLPWGWAMAALGLYFLVAIACARMRAELGPPAHDLHNAGPERLLTTFFGPRAFKPGELAALTWFYWFNRAYRSIPITHEIESLKLAERQQFAPRELLPALVTAAVVGTLAGFWAHLDLGYRWGVTVKMAGHLRWFGVEAYSRLDSWLTNPQPPDHAASLALLAGALQALTLHAIRLHSPRWPFHPLGLAVAGSWSMGMIWLPLMLSWVVKTIVLKYGGMKLYRRTQPFFIGLVLGDYILGCAWPLYGWIAGVPTYSFQQ